MLFQIDATDPKSFLFQALHQMAANESPGPTDNNASHGFPFR
jgi:hypothetical protein